MSLPFPVSSTTTINKSTGVTAAAANELYLDPTERYEVCVVKAAERPQYLSLSRSNPTGTSCTSREEVGVDDEVDNVSSGLTDGCDIPEWRSENMCGLSSRQISLLSSTVWKVGSCSPFFRRDSQWPVIVTKTPTTAVPNNKPLLLSSSAIPTPTDTLLLLPPERKGSSTAKNTTTTDSTSPWEELYHKLLTVEPPSSPITISYQEALDYFPYEHQNNPVKITDAATHWKAMCPINGWTFQNLVKRFGNICFRFSDTHGEMMTLQTYAKYINSIDGGLYDDSPLAIYDSEFGNPNSPLMELLQEYSVPKCFSDDLFDLVEEDGGSHRPPFRWILIGPARSGTGMHIDPLWTNAWVTLLEGQKRWILFPPSVPPELIGMAEPPIPSVIWFHRFYDKVISSLQTLPEQQWKPVEILQQPGETVFVPNGWAHAVVNLSPTNVAITHNYASEYSLERIWQQAMKEEPEFAKKWYMAMKQKRPDLAQKIRVASR